VSARLTRRQIARETAIGVVINTLFSVGFFLLVFGRHGPVAMGAMAADFLPQTFMVVLMGTLVPSLILRRRAGRTVPAVVGRSLGLAVAAVLVVGGGAYLACRALAARELTHGGALLLRAAFGAALSAAMTPLALRRL
jgi:hypothetical protein